MESFQAAQLDAFQALVQQSAWDVSLEELVTVLVASVLSHDGLKAFSLEQISAAVAEVQEECNSRSATPTASTDENQYARVDQAPGRAKAKVRPKSAQEKGRRTHLVQVIDTLTLKSSLSLSDVLGQILWQHRSAKILRLPRFRNVVEDMRWIDAGVFGPLLTGSMSKSVIEVFRQVTGNDEGVMKNRHWCKVVRMLEKNPVLQARLVRSDTDRLFWHYTHQNRQVAAGISCGHFLRLLVELAEAMSVHPGIIFLAVGSHAGVVDSTQSTG